MAASGGGKVRVRDPCLFLSLHVAPPSVVSLRVGELRPPAFALPSLIPMSRMTSSISGGATSWGTKLLSSVGPVKNATVFVQRFQAGLCYKKTDVAAPALPRFGSCFQALFGLIYCHGTSVSTPPFIWAPLFSSKAKHEPRTLKCIYFILRFFLAKINLLFSFETFGSQFRL